MRTLEKNKNVVLKFANRVGGTSPDEWGNPTIVYGAIESISICLLPMDNEVEAQAYGVSVIGGKKAVLSNYQIGNFNEFTHIWIDNTPDINRQESEYVVKAVKRYLNNAILIIDKKVGG